MCSPDAKKKKKKKTYTRQKSARRDASQRPARRKPQARTEGAQAAPAVYDRPESSDRSQRRAEPGHYGGEAAANATGAGTGRWRGYGKRNFTLGEKEGSGLALRKTGDIEILPGGAGLGLGLGLRRRG